MNEIQKANYDAIKARTNEQADKLLGLYFPVLDHGFVALTDYFGTDACIAQAARCSYGPGTKSISDDRGLIRYLINHSHTSPLEMSELKFHLKMPIMVARQLVRHRTCSMNEISGRYSVMPLEFYSPKFEDFKYQSSDNKQGRGDIALRDYYIENRIRSDTARALVSENYTIDLKNNIARELARIDLPLSTYTEMYWKMDLHNLLHFLNLRCDNHAQYEIRVFANIIAGFVKEIFPIVYDAWMNYQFMAQKFSYQEMKLLLSFGKEFECFKSCKNFEIPYFSKEKREEWCLTFGLSKREINEFFDKLILRNIPDYTLDISTVKSPSYFKDIANKCVPNI